MSAWLYRHWVPAALLMGIFLLLLAPVLTQSWPLPILMIYLQAPMYMLHQVEEHRGDRFRQFVNRAFGGVEALTPEAILWINIPGVWGVTLLSLYTAAFLGLGWGLAGIYLILVNSVAHLAAFVAMRRYNPGLWTTFALFIPIGGAALRVVSADRSVEVVHHAAGLAIALAIHAAIILHTRVRVMRLTARRAGQ